MAIWTMPRTVITELNHEDMVAAKRHIVRITSYHLSHGVDIDLRHCQKLGDAPAWSNVYRLADGTVLKTGPGVRRSEAEAMKLVAEKTDIPVPQVLASFENPVTGFWCIHMRYIEGVPLEEKYDLLTDLEKHHLIQQLQEYMRQMRGLERKPLITAVDGSPGFDRFLHPDAAKRKGPSRGQTYSSESQFFRGIAKGLEGRGEDVGEVVKLVQGLSRTSPESADGFVLTHGDLTPTNILVRGATVVGILDWSEAGYYPTCWEHVKAKMYWDSQSGFLRDNIPDRVLEQENLVQVAVLLHVRNMIW